MDLFGHFHPCTLLSFNMDKTLIVSQLCRRAARPSFLDRGQLELGLSSKERGSHEDVEVDKMKHT